MALYNGWTPELPDSEKRKNELAALRDLVADNPDNEYWWDRLIALEAEIEAEFIAHWFSETHITRRSNPALLGRYVPTDQDDRMKRARSISLDENGNLRPYSQYPGRSGAVVNLEDEKIHGWKLE